MNRRTTSKITTIAASLALALGTVVLSTGPAAAESDVRPDPPANLRVTDVQPDSITVTWDPVPGATEYSVVKIPLERSPDSSGGLDTEGTTATLDGLAFDVRYHITVRAFVPSAYPNWWTDTSDVMATTPVPEGYEPPSSPTNLRVERDSQGDITRIRWDEASGSFGPLIYRLHLETPDHPFINGTWSWGTGTSVDAGELPLCDVCIFEPGETLEMWVTATDRAFKRSPPSESLKLECCPL